MRAPFSAVVVALAASACTASGEFVAPARGGPAWHEVTSEHFVLRTDVGVDSARAMARELEAVRAAMLAAVVRHDVATPTRIEVVVFRSVDELMPFSQNPDLRGFAYLGDFGERRLAIAESWDASTRRVLAHEVAHVVTAYVVPTQPHWYAEGLATFLEGMGERRMGGGRTFGSPPGDSAAYVAAALKPPVRDVVEWRPRWLPENLYAGSYALVHYLYTERRAGFDELTRRLAALENPRSAWNAAFPEWSLDVPGATDALDDALRRHVRGSLSTLPAPATLGEWAVDVRAMTPAEVHTVRLSLPHRWTAEAERAEIAEALAADPAHVAALEARARRREGDPVALARAAVAAHPDDPAAWEFLASSLPESSRAERVQALRKAAELAPVRLRALLLLGGELARSGDLAGASTYTRRALEVAPWSAGALLLHGAVLADSGKCAEGLALGRRGVDVAFHYAPAAHRAASEVFFGIRRRCGTPAGDPEAGDAAPAAQDARRR